jgi:hypothetical protein
MSEQIAHLRELAKTDGITASILPFAAGAHRGMGSAFTVLLFDDPELDDLLYLENAERESSSREDKEAVRKYLDLFVELEDMAAGFGSLEDQIQRLLGNRVAEEDRS